MGEPLRYKCLSDPSGFFTGGKFHKMDFFESLADETWPEGSIWETPEGYMMIQDGQPIQLELVHIRQIMANRRTSEKRDQRTRDYYGRPNPR
jgi:hypothetical protein